MTGNKFKIFGVRPSETQSQVRIITMYFVYFDQLRLLHLLCTHSKWANEQTLKGKNAMHAFKNDTHVYYYCYTGKK